MNGITKFTLNKRSNCLRSVMRTGVAAWGGGLEFDLSKISLVFDSDS